MNQEAILPAQVGPESSFSDRVELLLAEIDCRPATSANQREEIFRLRDEADRRAPQISRHSFLSDRYDYAGDVYLLGLYVNSELASSIRLHVASKEQHKFPSREVFGDVLESKLDAGQILIDCTRFVADEHLSRIYPELPYATLRFCMLAAEHFNADHLVTAAGASHQAFYRRALTYKPVSEPRAHPDLATSVRLMTLHYPTAADDLYRRYPFFRSTPTERQRLFGHNKASAS
jgi:hypothetical protein